ncbi:MULTISPECIES: Ig-like domain-containing protein [Cedecea]|jgi:hypothetical protein|uniref:Uncharacterized protein n=1 Tax=Cedecea neteri TaxID=158822 RepID=A0A089PYV4_9ENTR|nr:MULTISPECIES: Ig-like domain-containing protein [Cedecea]AIR05567.1 hypothetical protein JT31_13385 [Cedecea neteri]NWC64469.1 hypothetical protein [Cedecea sp. P7760]
MQSIGYTPIQERASVGTHEINCIDFCVKEGDTPVGGLTLSFLCNGHARLSHTTRVTDEQGIARVYLASETQEDVSIKAFYYDRGELNFQYAIVNFF